jgi:hypothetical protein
MRLKFLLAFLLSISGTVRSNTMGIMLIIEAVMVARLMICSGAMVGGMSRILSTTVLS